MDQIYNLCCSDIFVLPTFRCCPFHICHLCYYLLIVAAFSEKPFGNRRFRAFSSTIAEKLAFIQSKKNNPLLYTPAQTQIESVYRHSRKFYIILTHFCVSFVSLNKITEEVMTTPVKLVSRKSLKNIWKQSVLR